MKACPFCGGKIEAFQGYADITYFACGSPRVEYLTEGCGAVISFRNAQKGAEAIAAYERRAEENQTCA
jgi:uncharacterized protein YceK